MTGPQVSSPTVASSRDTIGKEYVLEGKTVTKIISGALVWLLATSSCFATDGYFVTGFGAKQQG